MAEENPSSDIPKTTEGDDKKPEVPSGVQSSETGSSSEQSLSTPQTSSSFSGTVHSSSQTTSESKTSEEEPSARASSSTSQAPSVSPAVPSAPGPAVPSAPMVPAEPGPIVASAPMVPAVPGPIVASAPMVPAVPGPISPGQEVRVRRRGQRIRKLWNNIEGLVKGLKIVPKRARRALVAEAPTCEAAGPSSSTATTPAAEAATPAEEAATPAAEAATSEPLAWDKGRLTLDAADDEITEITSVSGSINVFLPDPVERKESVSSCDTGAHVSRLPSESEPTKDTTEDKRSPSKTTEDEE